MKNWIESGECLLDHSGVLLILVIGKWNKNDHLLDRFNHYIIFLLTTSSCGEVIDSLIVFLIIRFCLDSLNTFRSILRATHLGKSTYRSTSQHKNVILEFN